jgi:CheY-like chemotaxis protein
MTASFPILIAEDSGIDADLLEMALRKSGLTGPMRFVQDGQEAIDYLEGRGEYADRKQFPFPHVIITDLKMPRVDGLQLLQWLADHPDCCVIPTILLSGSALSREITSAYKLGANTYFQKPTEFAALLDLVRSLKDYWSRSRFPSVAA